MIIEPVAFIMFDNHRLTVYDDIDEPLFLAVEVAQLIDYSVGHTAHMVKYFCEDDEKLVAQNVRGGQRRNDWFVTEWVCIIFCLSLENLLLVNGVALRIKS